MRSTDILILGLVALIPAALGASVSGGSSGLNTRSRDPQSEAQLMVDNSRPQNTEDYPNGFWFGTQSLLCVMGMTGSASSGRKRRDVSVNIPSRSAMRFSHRLLYYQGNLYEWGTGTLGYFIGKSPSVVECEIFWEEKPTGNSTCSPEVIRDFTYDYRSRYGVYNIATNNCHHFVNRVSQLLSSPHCSAQPGDWTRVARRFWRYLGEMIEGTTGQAGPRLNDINDHWDRVTIN